jgi:hypothetical protein
MLPAVQLKLFSYLQDMSARLGKKISKCATLHIAIGDLLLIVK